MLVLIIRFAGRMQHFAGDAPAHKVVETVELHAQLHPAFVTDGFAHLGRIGCNVKRWLDLLGPVKRRVQKLFGDNIAKREWLTERLSLVNSLENLLSYPDVKAKFKDNELKIYAWHYIIETGEIYNYNFVTKSFKLLGVEK